MRIGVDDFSKPGNAIDIERSVARLKVLERPVRQAVPQS